MSPTLHVMRHGQGFHSAEVTKDGHLIRDPRLTEKGKEQCRQRCGDFERHANVELLLASPLRRALETCQLSFAPCLERGLVIVAVPHAEEVSDTPSDTGSPLEVLREEFGEIDFDFLKENWFVREGEFSKEAAAVNERAKKLRRWIKARPEKEIALVSHGFFNHFLSGEVDDKGEQTTPCGAFFMQTFPEVSLNGMALFQTAGFMLTVESLEEWWNEAELRTYTFLDTDDEMASIHETQGSLQARGGLLEGGDRFLKVNQPALRGKAGSETSG